MGAIPPQIVADFYDASLDAAGWPQALFAIAEWCKADAAFLLNHDFGTGTGAIERAIGIGADAQASYRHHHGKANAWLQAEHFFRGANAVVRGSDILDAHAIKSTPFYRSWLKPIGILPHLFAVLERQNGRVTLLVLARREQKADFNDEIVEDLGALLPALSRAVRVDASLRAHRALERSAMRAIDSMPCGVAILDRNGALIEANPFAKAVIDAHEGVVIINGGLATDVAGRRMKLKDMLPSGLETTSKAVADHLSMLSVPRASGKRPLNLMIVPLDDALDGRAPDGPAALLFIGDPERAARFDQTRIARLYGLSRAESRVAALLASGYRLEQVAEALDIAYETVRKHLKQIFSKTGTYRQAELVRMLVTGPAGLAI
ncbi:MAG: hypothetical protein IPK66_19045 [Rhodospirillales bacterium]|nr:hypothetical protein [Rhodospirillales bacterium]